MFQDELERVASIAFPAIEASRALAEIVEVTATVADQVRLEQVFDSERGDLPPLPLLMRLWYFLSASFLQVLHEIIIEESSRK